MAGAYCNNHPFNCHKHTARYGFCLGYFLRRGSELYMPRAMDFYSSTPVACFTCRRRKMRCSRDRPSCSSCITLGSACSYPHSTKKPGPKPGKAIVLSAFYNWKIVYL
ncbi:hypothetical protein ACQKWADRAFT_299826 [Trichoderma austrokoningii]